MDKKEITSAKFLVGACADHTPAFSKKTLFVNGKQDMEKILKLAKEHTVSHIYLGAHTSFSTMPGWDDIKSFSYWNTTMLELLEKGYWVTLEYSSHAHCRLIKVLDKRIIHSKQYVPVIYIKVPDIETYHPNLTIKIDDGHFMKSNQGVWCYNYHEIMDSNKFTAWNEYNFEKVTVETHIDKDQEDMNQESTSIDQTGLDTTPNKETELIPVISTPQDAADAYAANATEDPLDKEVKRKILKVKK
jgi:hypothetical protein